MPDLMLRLIEHIGKMDVYGFAARQQALLFLAGQGGQQLIFDQNVVRG